MLAETTNNQDVDNLNGTAFNDGNGGLRVGTVISNLDFSAGAFDMASAEKFCKLLVECAEQHLPIVCFIDTPGASRDRR